MNNILDHYFLLIYPSMTLATALAAGETENYFTGSIIEVAVAPDCRRKGIAKALITQAIQSADGPAAVFLEVRESNAPAVSLYEALGFEQIGERKDYYDRPKENAIIMRKNYENTCNRKQL